MRIGYFIDSLFSGGAQRQAVALASELVSRAQIEAKFFVYHPHDFFAETLQRHDIPVEQIPKTHKLDPLFPLRLRRSLLAQDLDLVHAFLYDPAVWVTLALKSVPAGRRPPLLLSERCSLIASTPAIRAKQFFAYRNADAVTSNAEPVAREISAKLGIAKERLHYIPNGIDLAQWDRDLESAHPSALDPEKFNLGLVGRLEPEKNHIHLVRAIARLSPALRARLAVWFIGGEGAEASNRREIEAEIDARHLGGQIHFVAPQREIAPWMAGFDALALPSQREAFPNAVLEAMASRTPVVASDVGDVPSLVDEGMSGFVVPRDDEAQLSGRIAELMEMSPSERRAMGERGRARVEDHYRLERIADDYMALYRSLTARTR